MEKIITEKDYPIEGIWILKGFLSGYSTGSARVGSSPLVFFLIYLIAAIIIFFSSAVNRDFNVLSGALLPFFVMFIVAISFWLAFLIAMRATFHYSIEDNFLALNQGILSKQERHLPYGVIQNIFINQDLWDRIFGIASLTIEDSSGGGGAIDAALSWGKVTQPVVMAPALLGFGGNKVYIPGLTKQNAEALKEIILRKMKENPMKDIRSGL